MSLSDHEGHLRCHLFVDTFQMEYMETPHSCQPFPPYPSNPDPLTTPKHGESVHFYMCVRIELWFHGHIITLLELLNDINLLQIIAMHVRK